MRYDSLCYCLTMLQIVKIVSVTQMVNLINYNQFDYRYKLLTALLLNNYMKQDFQQIHMENFAARSTLFKIV